MGCIITYENKQYTQKEFEQYFKEHFTEFVGEFINTKPDVILPIGTSGSGKSTFIKSLPQENLVVIEPDAMRVEFTGDMNNKSKDEEIYIEAANRAIQAIKQGKQVVFDTTNLTKDKRLPFIEAIKKAIPTANIQYKLMELNPELAKQRIKADIAAGKNRANVPDTTIDRHAESYKQMLEDIKSEPISKYKELGGKQDIEGFKQFVGREQGVMFQLEETPTSTASPATIAKVKKLLEKMGVVVKDIVYHATPREFDKFDKDKIASNTLNYGFYGKGFYFNETKNDLINWWKTLYKKDPNIVTTIINTKNPYKNDSSVIEENTKLGSKKETEEFTNNLILQKYDSVLPQIPKEQGSNEYVVFEPEQIHILSGKKDLEMFKNFINFTKSEYAKYGDIQQFRDYVMSKNFAAIEEFLVVNNKIDRKC